MIWAVSKLNPEVREIVATVWDDSDEDELREEAEKDTRKLINQYGWDIAGYMFRPDVS